MGLNKYFSDSLLTCKVFFPRWNTELTLTASLTTSVSFLFSFFGPSLFVYLLADVVDGVSVEGVDEEGRSDTEAVASHADDVIHTNPEEELSSSCLMEDDFTNSSSDLASLGNPTLHDLCLCTCERVGMITPVLVCSDLSVCVYFCLFSALVFIIVTLHLVRYMINQH